MYPWTDGENNYINYLLMYNKNQPNVGTFQGTNIYRLGCIPFGEKENDLQTFRCQLPPYSFVTLHGNQKVRMQARKSWWPQLQFLTHSSLNWESLVPVLKTGGVLSPELLAHFWRGNSHILFPTHF